MAKTINGIKVGLTTISASYTDGGVTKTASASIEVVRAAGSVSTVPVNANAVYGSGNKLCSAGSGTGTMMYRVGTTGNFSSTIPTTSGLNAGTYTLYYYAAESDSHNQSNTGSISVTIQKATVNPTFANTSVSANLNPTNFTTSPAVNCSAFTGATVGHSGGLTYTLGTVKNSSNSTVTGWSITSNTRTITVPASTPGGKYTATVTVTEAETSNYKQGTASATITITVNKKNQTAPTASGATNTYATSGAITGSASGGGCTGNTINYKSDTAGGTNYGTATTTAPSRSRTSVGTTTFIAFWPGNDYWNASSNSSQAKLIVNKATLTVTEVNYSNAYDGSSHSSSIKVTSPNWDGKIIVSGTSTSYGTTVTNAGAVNTVYNLKTATNYTPLTTIYYKITGGTNYNDYADSVTFEITKTSGSVSTAPTNAAVTYGSGSNLCSAGSGTGTMQYKLDNGSWSSTIPTATTSVSAGNHTLYYRAAESTNYYQSNEGSITVTVAKKGVTVSWGATSWTYDGSAHSTTCSISSGVISGTSCSVSLSGNSVGPSVGSKTVTASLNNSNYTISSGGSSNTLSINAKVVTLSWGTLTWVYDGNSHGTTCTVSNLVGSDTCTVTLSNNSVGAAVSTKTVTATGLSNGNYTLTGASDTSKTLSITQKTATLVFDNLTHTYDATSHTATCYVSNLESSDSCTVTLSNASRTNQGTQTVTATGLSNPNYALPTAKTATLTINKRPIKITAASSSRQYNGSALTNNNATAESTGTNRGLVSGHEMTSCTVTGTITNVGSVDNIAKDAVIKSGSTTVTDNYDITYVNGKLTITQRSVTITAPQFVNTGLTYNGSNQTVASGGSCTAGGTMYYYISTTNSTPTFNANTWSTSASIQAKPAGTYYVWYYCKVDDTTNNTGTDINTVKKLPNSKEIVRKTVTLTWGKTSWTYDGNAHSTTCQLGGLIGSDSCTLSLNNNSITYVGDQIVTTSLNNSNYQLPSASTKTITVTKATPTITITGVNQTYTGTPYYAKVTKTDAKGKLYWKKGSAASVNSYDGSIDINDAKTPVGNPAALSSAINITSVKNDADDFSLYWLFVPSSSETIITGETYADNFKETSGGPVSMTINKANNASVSVTINTNTMIYNGSAQTLATATSVGTSSASIGYKRDSEATSDSQITWVNVGTALSATNAGTYYIYKKWTADANHSNSMSFTLVDTNEIELRPIKITAGSDSRAYNGSALTVNSASPESTGTNRGLVSGHSMTSCTVVGSQTYVGSSNNVPSSAVIKSGNVDVTENYNIDYVKGTLTVTKANPQIAIQGITVDYTGGQFYAKVTGTKAKGTLYWKKGSAASASDSAVAINSTGTPLSTPINITSVKDNIDDFIMYWYFVPSSAANSLASGHTYAENYNTSGGTSTDKVNLTINPRSISKVTASAATVIYNGSQQTANVSISDSGATLTANDYTISGNTGTNANDYTITITGRNNYTGTKTITWTINKRPVTITADSASKTYDGTALTKNSVTAAAASGDTGIVASHHVHTWTVSGSQTIAGSTSNTVTAATIYNGASSTHGGSGDTTNVTNNYAITFAEGKLTVNKRAVTYNANDESKVYDGSKLTASNTATLKSGSLPSNHTVTFTCGGEIGPGVSSGTKTLSGVVIKNGSGADVSSSFTITKNSGTLKITNASITYSTYTSASKDCTDSAVAMSTTDGNRVITIATDSASGVGGSTGMSYSISQSGWSISEDGKTITVPGNVEAKTYNIEVSASKANHTTKTNGIQVIIKPVTLTDLTMELTANSVAYGSSTTVKTLTAKYSNGKSKSVIDNATYSSSPTGIVTIS